jgi:hypothetical protein
MNYKLLGSAAALLMLLIFPVSASMVSFLVVETGLDDRITNTQYSSLWEGGLMAVFFDAGHIVTNYPITRMDKKPASDLSGGIGADFNEAVENGAEYFILGFMEYQGSAVPVGITLKLYRTSSRELVFERRFPAGTGRSFNEEFQFAQSAGRIIISNIKDR